MSNETVPSYAGYCPECKGLVFVSVDLPEYTKNNAKDIAKAIRDGMTIGKMTVGEVKKSDFGHKDDCPFVKQKKRR